MAPVQEIQVRKVTKLFGATAALRGVSCTFRPKTVTFVQGANGAGKSTLMSIVGTTLRPTSGVVRYPPFGREQREVRGHIGWVGHDSHCYPDLSGEENVTLSAKLYGVIDIEASVREACGRVGAEAFFSQPVRTLSRGQKQRVALAKALAHRPSVLLLDEPLSGLDAASGDRFLEIVEEERQAGRIIVVVSHRDVWLQKIPCALVRLDRGRVIEERAGPAGP